MLAWPCRLVLARKDVTACGVGKLERHLHSRSWALAPLPFTTNVAQVAASQEEEEYRNRSRPSL